MKFEKAVVAFIDLGEEEILTNSGDCKNDGHDKVHGCTEKGNQNAHSHHHNS